MRFCKQCGRLSPSGAEYCVGCGGSFGGRRCGKGHTNPPSASHCATCGSGELSTYAPSVRLGWVPHILAFFFLVILVGIGRSFLPLGSSWTQPRVVSNALDGARMRWWLYMNKLLGDAIFVALFLIVSSFLLGKHRSIFSPFFKVLIWLVRLVITLARVVLEGLETLLHLSKPKGKGH